MKRIESFETVASFQEDQKQILYNEIRDVQIELKKYCSQKNFELFLINKESQITDKEVKNFKIELKKYYIQQFFIQISIQKINPRFLYNIDPEFINDKEKNLMFNDIITNSISFKDFIHLSTKIPINDYFQIYLWTFSVIPSYFNFFLSNDDESYFLFFLEKIKDDYNDYFNVYSSIVYFHPLFLSFCKEVFDPVFELILHNDPDQCDPPSKFLQNLEKTIHLCPSIVTKVLQMIPESNRLNHVNQHLYEQLVLFPHRFFVIPEYYVLSHRTIQVLKLALENFIEELLHNQNPLNLHFHDRNNLIFATSDLEMIKHKMNLSKRRISNVVRSKPNFNDSKKINTDQIQNFNQDSQRSRRAGLIQNSTSSEKQNSTSIPSFNQNQELPLNQNENQYTTSPKSQSQNNESIPSLNQIQKPKLISNPNQNLESIPSLNQNPIPSLVQNKNQESIPSFNQNQKFELISSPNQNQETAPNQAQNYQNSRRSSLVPNKSSIPDTKATRRLSLAPKLNQNQENKQNLQQATNTNTSQKLSSEHVPQSNFTTSEISNFNRKRSVSAAAKAKSDLPINTTPKTNSNYKYAFIEVSKGQERGDASDILGFENCLNDSFLSSSEELYNLSASLSSSSSSIFLSDWQAFQSSTFLTREEVSGFFHNFRKLLQNSDILPILDFKGNNGKQFDIINVLYEFLVSKGGSFSTLIARAACFESIRQHLNRISGGDLRRMIISYKRMARSMKELYDEKQVFNSYQKKTKSLFEKTFIFYKLIFRLGDTFLYDESRRKTSQQIVNDPFSFYSSYEQSRSIDPVIAKLQYHAFIHNLRFFDFCKSHPELKKYDDLMYSYMECNRESVIHSQPKSAKLFDKLNLIKDRFMFDPIVKSIQHAFEINAVPYEKFEIIRKCFENVESWLRSIMEYGADDMLPFTIFIFALANPIKFVSNSVFMYIFLLSSIWKIDPNDTPVILTRLRSFIGVIFNSFTDLSSFLPLKVFKLDILYILDYSKLVDNENSQDDANNMFVKKSNYVSLIDSIDEDKIREQGKPFRAIYQDESPIIGELIFHDCSQNFSLNANINININNNPNPSQNQNENENTNVITNLISNVIGPKKNQYDILVIESDKIDFVKKAVSKNKNIPKKIIFCNKSASDEMKQIDIQCFKILPRFSLCKALKEIFNLVVKIE